MSDPNDRNQAIIEEFRANDGIVGGYFKNSRLLLLHTTGAKSGTARINPLIATEDGDRLIAIASKAGAPDNPDWYYNVLADPDVRVEYGPETFDAAASVAEEPERTRLYDLAAAGFPGFAEYAIKTDRQIPVIILTRRA